MNQIGVVVLVLAIGLSVIGEANGFYSIGAQSPQATARSADDAAALAAYRMWKAESNARAKIDLAIGILRTWPCSRSAASVFYFHFFAKNAPELDKYLVSKVYFESTEPTYRSRREAGTRATDGASAPRCAEYRDYALGHLAIAEPDPLQRAHYKDLYCNDYDCDKCFPHDPRKPASAKPSN